MYPRCLLSAIGLKREKMGLIASKCDMYVGAPALEFATLLEVTKAVPLYVHAGCT